jgi:hypothetical protein
VDWRESFRKYVGIVSDAEGVHFLHPGDWPPGDWAEIVPVIHEAGAMTYEEAQARLTAARHADQGG